MLPWLFLIGACIYHIKPHLFISPAEFYDVVLQQCPKYSRLQGEYVVQFSSPDQFNVWGLNGQLLWEWPLSNVRRIGYQKSTKELEVEVGRFGWGGGDIWYCY